MYYFQVDRRYTRKDVYKIIGIPVDTKGGNWDTGYNKNKEVSSTKGLRKILNKKREKRDE